jgi:DNA-binding IclR family transcriptional regulator
MLTRGLSLLLELGEHPAGLGLSDLARRSGVPISTAYRLLSDLQGLGFATFDEETRRYTLGLAVFELSHRVSAARGLSDVARPVMQRVSAASGETCLLAVLDGIEIVYVQRVDSPQRVQIAARIGRRGPVYCTSMGKCLLAFQSEATREELLRNLRFERFSPNTIVRRDALRRELERVRARGYAIADEEYDAGIRAVGVPVLDARERPVAALCVSAPAFRTPIERLESFVPVLREAAATIGVQLTSTSRMG